MDTLSLGERITECRLKKGLRQQDLAAALGVAPSTISHWEDDDHKPSFKRLTDIAEYFDVSVDYLLGRTDYSGAHDKLSAKFVATSEGAVSLGQINNVLLSLDDKQRANFMLMLDNIKEADGVLIECMQTLSKLQKEKQKEARGFLKGLSLRDD